MGGSSKSGVSGDKTQPNWDSTENTFDYWIVKIDSLGNKQWDKVFGGIRNDYLYSVHQTYDGGYLLGGYSYSGISGDKTQPNWDSTGNTSDYWVVKIDSIGNQLWDKDFGGTSYDLLTSLSQTFDKGFILAGNTFSGISGDKTEDLCGGIGDIDYWIIKIDSFGNKQWDKDLGGNSSDPSLGNISQTIDGGLLIGGSSLSPIGCDKTENNLGNEEAWTIKTDSLGFKQWDKTLHTNTLVFSEPGFAIQTKDGCYVIANFTAAGIGGDKSQPNWDNSNSTSDYWIIKFCDSTLTTSLTPGPSPKESGVVFPNPANDHITISGLELPAQITMFDVFGREVFSQTLNLKPQTLNPLLPNGIYIIKAYTGKEVLQQKLVIQHP